MSNYLTAFGDQLKYIRDDISSISKQLDVIKNSVNIVNIQVAKLEQQNEDRLSMCNAHTKSIEELYGRMTCNEISLTQLSTRIDESTRQDVAVEKAKEKYNDWIKWWAPHLWKLALAVGTVAAAIEYYLNMNARPK